jgi:formyl-CoA transferase
MESMKAGHESGNTKARPALQGLKVVDFSRQIAGPFCAMLLSDLGADVIKIEQPGRGDDSRRLVPTKQGMSSVFISTNRNKRSIEIDLKSPAGLEVARDLISGADVLVENFSRGVMDRMGLGYDALSELHPGLVYCSVTSFGNNGRFADRPGFDPVTQADCGLFSLNGYADRPPVRVAPPVVDVASGLTATIAVQSALLARHATGRGQHVEVALFDVGVTLTSYYSLNYLITGEEQYRTGNESVVGSPSGLFTASDGDFFMSCSTDRMFKVLASDVIAKPEIAEKEEFITNSIRCDNDAALRAILMEIFATRKKDHWIERLLAGGIPAGNIRSIGEAIRSEEMKDRGLVSSVEHPTVGQLPNIAAPFRLAGTPLVVPAAPPLLGEHTQDVLEKDLGYSAERIQALKQSGAFGSA